MSRATPPSSTRALGLFAVGAGLPNLLALTPLRPLLIAGCCALYWLAAAGHSVQLAEREERSRGQKACAAGIGLAACLCWAWTLHPLMPEVEAPWLRPEAKGLRWAWLLIVVLLAPLAEERFFRGALFTTLEGDGRVRLAVVGSALAFAAAHPYGAPAATALGAGVALGLVRAWTGDWRVSVVIHAVFNAAVWAALQQSV